VIATRRGVRFEGSESDVHAGELRKHGVSFCEASPAGAGDLLERAGDVVSREAHQQAI
jgi:hypothetical protein